MRPGCYSMQSALLGLILWTIASPAIAAERNHSIGVTVPQADLSVGFTLQAPADVNVEPFCTDLSLPLYQSENGSRPRPRGFRCRVCAPPRRPCWRGQRVRQLVVLVGHERGTTGQLRAAAARWRAREGDPPAVGGRKATGVRIFGQLLAGTEWSSVFGGRRAIQPGGGIDARIRDACVVRVQLDYTFVPGELRNLSGSRVLVGLVYGFGSREP